MNADKTLTKEQAEAERLVKLADLAPPPQRSKVMPYFAVVLTLRNKGYSYEKVADFLTEHTGREFTRSQIFAFVQRNPNIFATIEQDISDDESEPLPGQLFMDFSDALLKCVPNGYEATVNFLGGKGPEELDEPPPRSGRFGKEFCFACRARMGGTTPVPEWWDGKKWVVITERLIRDVAREFAEREYWMTWGKKR